MVCFVKGKIVGLLCRCRVAYCCWFIEYFFVFVFRTPFTTYNPFNCFYVLTFVEIRFEYGSYFVFVSGFFIFIAIEIQKTKIKWSNWSDLYIVNGLTMYRDIFHVFFLFCFVSIWFLYVLQFDFCLLNPPPQLINWNFIHFVWFEVSYERAHSFVAQLPQNIIKLLVNLPSQFTTFGVYLGIKFGKWRKCNREKFNKNKNKTISNINLA